MNKVLKRILMPLALVLAVAAMALPLLQVNAATRWNLEGWRIDQTKWIGGQLFTYFEDDWVPYRMVAQAYDGTEGTISVQHDYMDSGGDIGIDAAGNWFIGPIAATGSPADSVTPYFTEGNGFSVSDPIVVPVSNGSMLEWTVILDAGTKTALQGYGEFAIYWEAHLSLTGGTNMFTGGAATFGSSYWNGASLHAHTSVTGNQDVPIKTPAEAGGIDEVLVDLVKVANPTTVSAAGTEVTYTYTVTNTGTVELTGLILTDDNGTPGNVLDDFTVTLLATTLAPGALTSGTAIVSITQDQIDDGSTIINTATVTSNEGAEASDFAEVAITQNPAVTIEKTGAWVDGDADGYADPGELVNYTFTVTNTGNVTLTNVTVTDPL
ncbi:DUF11 domain-containing protein, partial [Dehalogenimonas sp. THU2]|uniref:DUF11 domain-containing protein n=1 Tax=Dehalogenimonas sp. THU2 TaxID=3151121 RepID=UPI003218521D